MTLKMIPRYKITAPDPRIVRRLQTALGCDPIMATVLTNRGFKTETGVRTFLHPALSDLRPPFSLKDMTPAVTRITQALKRQEKILIFGDYDVDGVTSTALLSGFLRHAGADVSTHIPHRIEDGYSLSADYIAKKAVPGGIDLIITVDNGSTSHEAVNQARSAKIDVIIVDHHVIVPPYPDALAVINPKRADCPAGLADLAGVGVAFALLICLRKYLRDRGFWQDRPEPNLKNDCDLVALGTVADMVPLRRDNRILTQAGLNIIRRHCRRPGLQALVETAGISADALNAEDIAFRLAPRINAAGRMAHADIALSLLTAEDPADITARVRHIEELNTRRRETQKQLFDRIQTDIAAHPDRLTGASLVLWGENWPEGVLGIVAAHLLQEYHRPVVLISTRNGIGKGSARSLPGFDLYRGLTACRDTLLGYGGHALAAGVTVDTHNLENFRKQFERTAQEAAATAPFDTDTPVDAEISLNDISEKLLDELETLAPFGAANREPLFLARDVAIVSSRIVGRYHLSLRLRQRSRVPGRTFQGIHFNIDPEKPVPKTYDQIVFRVGWNDWNQTRTPRIIIEAV